MPPVTVTVGLIVALAGPVCLAAQSSSPAEASRFPAETRAGPAAEPSLDQSDRQLRAATSSPSGRIERVGLELPSPLPGAERSPGSDRPGPPRQQAEAGPEDGKAGPGSLPPPGGTRPIPLKPPSRSNPLEAGKRAGEAGGLTSVVTVASSLAVVLGLFLVVAWIMRRAMPGGSVVLPSEVVEVLGRAALAGRAQVQLLRCGNRLLLVSTSATGVETLTEITDAEEVNRLAGLCRQAHPASATAAFRQVFQQLAGERTVSGPPGTMGDDVDLANAGIRTTHDGRLEGRDV